MDQQGEGEANSSRQDSSKRNRIDGMAKSRVMTGNSDSEGVMNEQSPGGSGSKDKMPHQKPPEKYTMIPTMVVRAPKASSLNTSALAFALMESFAAFFGECIMSSQARDDI